MDKLMNKTLAKCKDIKNYKKEYEINYYNRILYTKKIKRLYNIIQYIKDELSEEYLEDKNSIIIMCGLFLDDIKAILQEEDIENYTIELQEISKEITNFINSKKIRKIAFFRKYKIWLLRKN